MHQLHARKSKLLPAAVQYSGTTINDQHQPLQKYHSCNNAQSQSKERLLALQGGTFQPMHA
jgi:hypothetical protein